MEFNEILINLRKQNGWSQEELGEKVNVSRQTVSKWELGMTTPELGKLKELSHIFHLSIDELVGNQNEKNPCSYTVNGMNEQRVPEHENCYNIRNRYHYEYKSKKQICGIPLVHINIGSGIYRAKGIIAIGITAQGVVAIGVSSVGIIAFGAVTVGLLAMGALAAGLLSFAGVAVGLVACGGVAVGGMAIGGLAVGEYALGGAAIGGKLAVGGYATGVVAVGEKVTGTYEFIAERNFNNIDFQEVKRVLLQEFPDTPEIVTKIMLRH